ncbi:MAG TPA: RlmE family RNA methyltransferase [Candidatus Acidoferrales bacterium]|nr:RlmE family RNA methyltransferase [Candidatus Acidoferrales bacterium]
MSYQPKDAFYRRAKKEGYRSRAAYKLLEISRRYRLIRPGDRVVDLGAAPGGWLQVAAALTGPKGLVIGVDLQRIEPFAGKNIVLLQDDISRKQTQEKIKELLGGAANCVLSDLSPPLTGIRDLDVRRSLELVEVAREFALAVLAPGGNFLAKTFLAPETNALAGELKRDFSSVARTRPEATRKASSEIYVVAQGFKSARG